MADDTSLPHPTPAATPGSTYDPAGIRTDQPVKPDTFGKSATPTAESNTRGPDRPGDHTTPPARGAGTEAEQKAKHDARAKLRSFEDKHLGRRAMRNNAGHVEKGYGSPFKEMSPEKLAEHAALEKLVEAEDRVDAANVDLSTAKAAVEVAKKAADEATKVADAAAVEAKRDADEDARAEKPVEQKSIDPSPGYAPAPAPRLDAFGKPVDPAQKGL